MAKTKSQTSPQPGPKLETLLRHLAECPSEFLETCEVPEGNKQTAAILWDHFRAYGEANPVSLSDRWFRSLAAQPSGGSKTNAMEMRSWGLMGIVLWLLHDSWFYDHPSSASSAYRLLQGDWIHALTQLVPPKKFIEDADRREELVRVVLNEMGLIPEGENEKYALDRRTTLDSVERANVMRATAAAERRAREVREAMAKKQALESASRYGE